MSRSTAAVRKPRCRTKQTIEPTKPHVRRVSAARESDDDIVSKVIPRGYLRPATQGQWRTVMRDAIDLAPVRRDKHDILMAVATMLMWHADWDTLTTRPTWKRLIEHCQATTGRGSERSIARAIAMLIEMQLIARVAGGRLAEHSPGDTTTNDAAIYVLLVPSRLRTVDGNGSPPQLQLGIPLPVRAREATDNDPSEPLRGAHLPVPAQAPADPQSGTDWHAPLWPGWQTTGTNGARLLASAELQRRLPVLRQISTADVRSCLREFWLAGWTVQDLHHALDWRPDGTRWPHDGANGIGPTGVRGWIAYRLAPWTSEGTPRRSFGQDAAARRAEELARQRAQRERQAAERAQHASTPPPVFLAAKAHLKHVRWHQPDPDCEWCQEKVIPVESPRA